MLMKADSINIILASTVMLHAEKKSSEKPAASVLHEQASLLPRMAAILWPPLRFLVV